MTNSPALTTIARSGIFAHPAGRTFASRRARLPAPPLPVRQDLTKKFISWGIRITPEDYDAFANLFEIQGARTWFLQKGLEKFLELVESSPSHRRWATIEVAKHMAEEGRPTWGTNSRELSVQIPTPAYVRFNQVLPMQGASSWFVRTFVARIVRDFAGDAQTLEDRVSAVVSGMVRTEEENQ